MTEDDEDDVVEADEQVAAAGADDVHVHGLVHGTSVDSPEPARGDITASLPSRNRVEKYIRTNERSRCDEGERWMTYQQEVYIVQFVLWIHQLIQKQVQMFHLIAVMQDSYMWLICYLMMYNLDHINCSMVNDTFAKIPTLVYMTNQELDSIY